MAIDWNFLGEVEGSAINRAYVPMKDGKPIQSSGVTVGTGVDLGAQSEDKLKRLGVSSSLIKKLKPFLGPKIRKDAAVKALEDAGGLTLSDAEVQELDRAIKQDHLKFVRNWFNRNNTKGMDWSDLTDKQQTVVLSVEYNHGPAALKKYNFGTQVANNEWDKVADNLRNFYSSESNELHSRRIKELQYLVGTDVDGIAGKNTDRMLEDFKTSFQGGDSVDFMGNATPAQHHRPAPAVEQPEKVSTDFPQQFMSLLQDAVKASQSQPQGGLQPVTEDVKQELREAEEKPQFTEAEEALINSAVETPEGGTVGGVRPDSDFTEAELNLINSAVGTVETEEPVYAETPEGEADDSRDPIYGIF